MQGTHTQHQPFGDLEGAVSFPTQHEKSFFENRISNIFPKASNVTARLGLARAGAGPGHGKSGRPPLSLHHLGPRSVSKSAHQHRSHCRGPAGQAGELEVVLGGSREPVVVSEQGMSRAEVRF